MSDFVDAPCNSMTSGAIQFGVPAGAPISSCFSLRFKETPKSVSLTSPVLVVKILAAFKSQWTTLNKEILRLVLQKGESLLYVPRAYADMQGHKGSDRYMKQPTFRVSCQMLWVMIATIHFPHIYINISFLSFRDVHVLLLISNLLEQNVEISVIPYWSQIANNIRAFHIFQ